MPWARQGTSVAGGPGQVSGAGGDVVQALIERVERLGAESSALHQELQTSSELIKALADQNALLIERVEAHRVRLRWLSALVLLMGLGLAGLWWRLA